MRIRPSLAVAAAASALALVPAVADARIVPGRSIGGVALGENSQAVNARLGVTDPEPLLPDEGNYVVYVLKAIGGYGSFDLPAACESDVPDTPEGSTVTTPDPTDAECSDGVASSITTRSRKQRTGRMIGPGTKESVTRRRLRNERCGRFYVDDLGRETVVCTVRTPDGKAATDYAFSRHRVYSVTVYTR